MNITAEILHSKKISGNAEQIWNWTSPAGKLRANRRAELIVSKANISANDKVLEIGCGTGIFTEKVWNLTQVEITAIDISPELLEKAHAKNIPAKFMLGNAMNLNFPDKGYDVVFGSSVLHHLKMEKALNEIFRVLKKNGRMVFAEPNMLNPQIFMQKNIPFLKRVMYDSPDESAIVRWKLKSLLRKTSFRNIEIFPYDFLHPSTPAILIPFVREVVKFFEKIPLLKEIAGSVIIYSEK